jgi:dihydrolipoamide dehydrogenase
MSKYDVTVIGGGPGGYVAAIRCSQLGMKVALIEKYPTLGGTCLNVGCIPSKALLDSSEHYYKATKEFSTHGIIIDKMKIDWAQMVKRKGEVVSQTCGGIDFLMKKNNITVINGLGSFMSATKIKITKEDKSTEEIESAKTIIATGSKPTALPFLPVDKKRIITSTEALSLSEIPKHLIIIGGGIIGVELGSVYKRLGSEVTVVEYLDKIVPSLDSEVGKEMTRLLKKQGFKILTSHKVTGATVKGKEVTVTAETDGKPVEIVGDYCLVAVGRSPYTEGLGLENAGVLLDDRKRIQTDDHCMTNVPNIYAIGDVIKGTMLAHKAEEEGVYVAEMMAGQKPHINYNLIPGVAYTWPEAAGVGKTEDELKAAGVAYKVGKFSFKASGRARASMDTDGFIKILADATTDEILGVQMIGPRIADLIIEAVVAMEFRASAEDIARMCHPHPTYSEAFKEACLDATEKRALHA